jgi:hypothetical protein
MDLTNYGAKNLGKNCACTKHVPDLLSFSNAV